jgi:hypothetical protein
MKVKLKPHTFAEHHDYIESIRLEVSDKEWERKINSFHLREFGINFKFSMEENNFSNLMWIDHSYWTADVSDETKFALFMLKFPDLIEKIVYE